MRPTQIIKKIITQILPYGLVISINQYKGKLEKRRLIEKRNTQLIQDEVIEANSSFIKLNIGCGKNIEKGWINIDIADNAEIKHEIKEGDPLPFKDNSVQAVFSEHFVEHINSKDFIYLLNDSYRILKHRGTIRILCPDLDFLLNLKSNRTGFQKLKDIYETIGNFKIGELRTEAQTINWAFYGHNHRFIYDFDYMKQLLSEAGFKNVKRMQFKESANEEFAIERRKSEAFYSLIVEAVKA